MSLESPHCHATQVSHCFLFSGHQLVMRSARCKEGGSVVDGNVMKLIQEIILSIKDAKKKGSSFFDIPPFFFSHLMFRYVIRWHQNMAFNVVISCPVGSLVEISCFSLLDNEYFFISLVTPVRSLSLFWYKRHQKIFIVKNFPSFHKKKLISMISMISIY